MLSSRNARFSLGILLVLFVTMIVAACSTEEENPALLFIAITHIALLLLLNHTELRLSRGGNEKERGRTS